MIWSVNSISILFYGQLIVQAHLFPCNVPCHLSHISNLLICVSLFLDSTNCTNIDIFYFNRNIASAIIDSSNYYGYIISLEVWKGKPPSTLIFVRTLFLILWLFPFYINFSISLPRSLKNPISAMIKIDLKSYCLGNLTS